MELYTKTKLVPDSSLHYDDKLSLKRRGRSSTIYYYWSAAASVAIILVAYFMLNKNGTPDGNNIVKHNQIKDSNNVATHNIKPIDTSSIRPKVAPNIPANNASKNNVVVINAPNKKQDNKKIMVPNNSAKDSTAIAVIKDKEDKHIEPVKKQITIPTHSGNDSLALNKNIPDTSLTSEPLVMEYIIDTAQQVTIGEAKTRKKRSKFLILLATLTCKGLHKVTGQHIELEKRYDSDTTTIIAYQLDLGNKKYEFPVKE